MVVPSVLFFIFLPVFGTPVFAQNGTNTISDNLQYVNPLIGSAEGGADNSEVTPA